jgi:hypothetical protein
VTLRCLPAIECPEGLFFAGHTRHQFDLFLFSPRHPLNPGAPAYTTLGGMSHEMADKDARGEYKKAIYFTPEFANKVDAASIVVHEFAHYCGSASGASRPAQGPSLPFRLQIRPCFSP